MNALTFKIELLQPLLVTHIGGNDENSADSLEYIPGSVLRNALAAFYIHKYQLTDAANDEICRSLFFDDQLKVLNSYRIDRLGNRSLPTPFSWIAEKEAINHWKAQDGQSQSLQFYDVAVDPSVFQRLQNVKSLDTEGKFCRLSESTVELIRPARQISVHIQRQHKRRLESKSDSQVFVYDALAEGEQFWGAILAPEIEQLKGLQDLLLETPEIQIGGSRSAGYGRIRFFDIQSNSEWHECFEDENVENMLIVTLLSDTIVRDNHGQFLADISPLIGVRALRCYRKMKPIGGFNRKWGLPLPQAYAIQAGSVFIYPYDEKIKERLKVLVEQGIGERRQDGFGRLALNWNLRSELSVVKIVPDFRETTISLKDDPASQRVAQRIVEYQLRRQLDRTIQQEVLSLKVKGGSRSALARVRLLARRSVYRKDLVLLQDFIANLKRAGKENLNKTRVGTIKLFDWLEERVQKRDVEEQLRLSNLSLPKLGDVVAQLTDEMRNEYTAHWIEAVVKRAYKEVSHD